MSVRVWLFMIRCSILNLQFPRYAWDRRPVWRQLLLAAGEKGKRFALPHSRILIHQPLGGFQGQATDIDIQAREILRLKDELNKILADLTGQPLAKIMNDTERDYFMTSEQAKEYGLIDEIIVRKPVLSGIK